MRRLFSILLVLTCAGCITNPGGAETSREVVLKYVDRSVGTLGPFANARARDLNVLSAADQAKVTALIERGAEGFLVIERSAETPNRVIVVLKGQIAGDFVAVKKDAN